MTHTKETKEKSEKKKILQKAFLKLGFLFLGFLVVFNTIQLAQMGGIVQNVDKYNQGVVQELGGIRNDVMTFADDLNEIRSFLLLPTKNYSFSSGETGENNGEEQKNSQTAAAVYSFLGKLENEELAAKNAQQAVEIVKNILADENFKSQLTENGLTAGNLEENEMAASFKILEGNTALFGISINKKTNEILMQSVLGSWLVNFGNPTEISAKIIENVKNNKTKVQETKQFIEKNKSDLLSFVKSADTVSLLKERKISFVEAPDELDDSIDYSFVNADQEKLFRIRIFRSPMPNSENQVVIDKADAKPARDINGLIPELKKQLETVDTSSAMEKMVKERRAELETVFQEEAFQDLLKKNEFTLTTQPREEYNKLLYDVKDKQGKVVFSFVLELSSGSYKVLKDNTEIDLFGAAEEDGSKKKS